MNYRQTDIGQRLGKWLERYAAPTHLRDKPDAIQAEAESLARILCKMAPQDEYVPFLNRVFDGLDSQMKSRFWPTSAEIGSVCANLRRQPKASDDGDNAPTLDPMEIISRRMQRGDPVGEGHLYGIAAVELIAAGKVTEQTMKAYRSGAFMARKATYGEAAALAWETEAKARHADAKDMYRQRNAERGHSGNVPDKRAFA